MLLLRSLHGIKPARSTWLVYTLLLSILLVFIFLLQLPSCMGRSNLQTRYQYYQSCREKYLAQQKLLQTARLTGLPLSPTANMASSGRTLTRGGSWNVSSSNSSSSLVGSGSALVSCGTVEGRRSPTVPKSPSRLGMRCSADSVPSATAASTSGKFAMLLGNLMWVCLYDNLVELGW